MPFFERSFVHRITKKFREGKFKKSAAMTMKIGVVARHSAPGWISFRNVLLSLIAMQITVLIAIGFSAPNDSSLEDVFQLSAENGFWMAFLSLSKRRLLP